MNNKIFMAVCLASVTVLAGCGSGSSSSNRTGSQSASVGDLLESASAEASKAPEATKAPEPVKETEEAVKAAASAGSKADSGVDIDLTRLSATMVYSEVFNMLTMSESYIGKTVKMKGAFTYYQNEESGAEYYTCIIQDATACCSQGVEFVLKGDYKYPEDYPGIGDEITVTGTFDTYDEGEYTYCTLRNATLG